MSKTIIGFAGRKRAGKTCLSKYLTEKYNGTIVTVADALKRLCCDLCGFKDIEELNYYKDKGTTWSFNQEKYASLWANTICAQVFGDYTDNQHSEILGLVNEINTYNIRELLQFVGTDIIRNIRLYRLSGTGHEDLPFIGGIFTWESGHCKKSDLQKEDRDA